MTSTIRDRYFGSIAAKLALTLLGMGGAVAAAVGIGYVVFSSVAISVSDLMEKALPKIEASARVMQATGKVRDSLFAIDAQSTKAGLQSATDRFSQDLALLETEIEALPEEMIETLAPMVAGVRSAASSKFDALAARLDAKSEMGAQVAELQELVNEIRKELAVLADTAQSNLNAQSAQAVATVRETLAGLTEREFAEMRAVLDIRAEVNLLASVALVQLRPAHSGLGPILDDLSEASMARLDRYLGQVASNAALTEELAPVVVIRDYLRQTAPRARDAATLLRFRQDSDAAMSEIIDNRSFMLAILAEDIAAENEAVIRALIERDVHDIREAAEIDLAVKSLLIGVLFGTNAETADDIAALQNDLSTRGAALRARLEAIAPGTRLQALVDRVLGLAAPDTGVLAARAAVLRSERASTDRWEAARVELARIGVASQDVGRAAMVEMVATGDEVAEGTSRGLEQMQFVAAASVVVVFLSVLAAWHFILRPMARVTRLTERLAKGDLAAVTGFEKTGGEIGQMAAALVVFRTGMIERQEMAEAEKEREAAEAKRRAAAAAEKQRAEEEAATEAARRREEDHRREVAEVERRAELERAAQAERDRRAAEQETVVTQLAKALDDLAAGDLTVVIDKDFAETYEALKANFNAATAKIAEVVGALTESAAAVSGAAQNMTGYADALADSAERSAASLEDTSAAVTELNSSAQSMARTAQTAHDIMRDAQKEAEASKITVEAAVATMSEVEASSNAVSHIVDLIENIAFQTNLLALNAGVEAARAGEQGRGFAVVATEVRALAQRSSEAASEINTLISTTRNQISGGVRQVNAAGEALGGILTFIAQISHHISDISIGADEQATTISGISGMVSQLDVTMQKNAAMFEASRVTSGHLTMEAAELLELAKRFKTGNYGVADRDDEAA